MKEPSKRQRKRLGTEWRKIVDQQREIKCIVYNASVLNRLLADPDWAKVYKNAKTDGERRRIIYDFSRKNGIIIEARG